MITGTILLLVFIVAGSLLLYFMFERPDVRSTIEDKERKPVRESLMWLIVWIIIFIFIGVLYYFGVLNIQDQNLLWQLI